MEKGKSNSKKAIIILTSLIIVAVIALTTITLAWFTSGKNFNASISFGVIEIDTTSANSSSLTKSVTRNIGDYLENGDVMPGDTINFNLQIKLTDSSEPAYYLVKVAGTDALSSLTSNGYYYYDSSAAGNLGVADSEHKTCGSITANNTISLAIPFVISTEFTTQGVSGSLTCTIYAIQQVNHTISAAYDVLDEMANPVITATISKTGVGLFLWDGYEGEPICTEMGFYKTSTLPSGYTLDTAKTTALQAELAVEDRDKISVYMNGTKLAFVSDAIIYAPADCSNMFNSEGISTIVFNNFNTSNVTNMNGMFKVSSFNQNSGYVSLDLSGWDVSNVTDMSEMFYNPTNLQSLNLSGWDVSNVTDFDNFLSPREDGGATLRSTLNLTGWEITSTQARNSFKNIFGYNGDYCMVGSVSGLTVTCSSDIKSLLMQIIAYYSEDPLFTDGNFIIV